jgi:hypothetical protein
MHDKTQKLLVTAVEILAALHPMTVRQTFYQLFSRQVIKNDRAGYQAVSNLLRDARKSGVIPWEWIEDRLRRPRTVSMWDDLRDFADTAIRAYRKDVWAAQPQVVEVWLEKDALSGIFEDVLEPYGVTLNVARGYDGWSSIRNAAERYGDGVDVIVLYYGDFDPSGEDMFRSLKERLKFFECAPEMVKCALSAEDVKRYNLPPNFTKTSDTRRKGFVDRFGDVSVELDALPVNVLRAMVKKEIEDRMDLNALTEVRDYEKREKAYLLKILSLAN